MVQDGLYTDYLSVQNLSGTTAQYKSVNGLVYDCGVVTGSGNTSVVTFARTFTATPTVVAQYQLGSLAVASLPVLSAIGTGSFSIAGGSNLAFVWQAIGSGTY